MKTVGRIHTFFPDRGFGFLYRTDESGKAISHFFHVTQVLSGTPVAGRTVNFIAMEAKRGLIAVDVEVIEGVK
jgi:cold shock CspA family protein